MPNTAHAKLAMAALRKRWDALYDKAEIKSMARQCHDTPEQIDARIAAADAELQLLRADPPTAAYLDALQVHRDAVDAQHRYTAATRPPEVDASHKRALAAAKAAYDALKSVS